MDKELTIFQECGGYIKSTKDKTEKSQKDVAVASVIRATRMDKPKRRLIMQWGRGVSRGKRRTLENSF